MTGYRDSELCIAHGQCGDLASVRHTSDEYQLQIQPPRRAREGTYGEELDQRSATWLQEAFLYPRQTIAGEPCGISWTREDGTESKKGKDGEGRDDIGALANVLGEVVWTIDLPNARHGQLADAQ